MAPPPLDGSLEDWSEIEDEHDWRALLLGNGLSINIWSGFNYRSLYRKARQLPSGGLTDVDKALFEAADTRNFEVVLADLNASMRVGRALSRDTGDELERYRSIQAALGEAVRAVHVPWVDVPASTMGTIQEVLQQYDWVFTTSYDLLIYWAMGHEDDYGRLVDLLWGGSKCRFNPKDTDVLRGKVPVFFLHGAMHLIAEGAGTTRKLKRDAARTLLDQFGQPIKGDPQARPLLVTEGSSRHKVQAIEANPYLAHAFERLQAPVLNVPLVVFGSSLGEQDRHLANAISIYPQRPVAVSMVPKSRVELREEQREVFGRLGVDGPLLFFDATTHPLGASDLAVPGQ